MAQMESAMADRSNSDPSPANRAGATTPEVDGVAKNDSENNRHFKGTSKGDQRAVKDLTLKPPPEIRPPILRGNSRCINFYEIPDR